MLKINWKDLTAYDILVDAAYWREPHGRGASRTKADLMAVGGSDLPPLTSRTAEGGAAIKHFPPKPQTCQPAGFFMPGDMAYHTYQCVCLRGDTVQCRDYVCAQTPQQAISQFQVEHEAELEREEPSKIHFEAEACE